MCGRATAAFVATFGFGDGDGRNGTTNGESHILGIDTEYYLI